MGQCWSSACREAGKTTTILRRIHYMIENGIEEDKILMITFTKAAADEMEARFIRSYGEKTKVTFCTIHSLCLALAVQIRGYTKDSVISNPSELLCELLKSNRTINDREKFVQEALTDISVVKNSQCPLAEYQPKCCEDKALFQNLYQKYEEKKRELNRVDFDDILLLALESFKMITRCCPGSVRNIHTSM